MVMRSQLQREFIIRQGRGGDRGFTFQLINGVALKGGYAGFGEADPNERDIELYETVLSGDLDDDDESNFVNYGENSYHVVLGNYTDANAILDGFIIRGGNADSLTSSEPTFYNCGGGMCNFSGSPTVKNCKFIENYALTMGGGIFNRQGSSPVITNCAFVQNRSDDDGGGMRNYINCDPSITDCSFINNSCFEEGGGIGNRKNSNPVISNCNFTGNAASSGGAMENHLGTAMPTGEPVIINCLFVNNTAESGGGIRNNDPSPIMTNCTFSNNSGSGMLSRNGSIPIVKNCIFWNNAGGSFGGDATPVVTFSNIDGGFAGIGNIDTDPFFANSVNGDFHLKSQAGRWEADTQSWIEDGQTSRCVDAGNPSCPLVDEPNSPGNLRINMGAYGGTAEASKAPGNWSLLADLNNDGVVDLVDFSCQANDRSGTGDEQPCDLNRNGIVDIDDLCLLTNDWLRQTSWAQP